MTNGHTETMEAPAPAKRGGAKAPKSAPMGITIPAPNVQLLKVTVRGDSPLICHRFGAKARKMMLDKQMKKATRAKEAKDPEADFRESLYPMPGKTGVYGFPCSGFKKAAVAACSFVDGVTKVVARGAFHILGDLAPIDGPAPIMREDTVRLSGTTADIRHRAQFDPWSVTLTIRYNASVLSAEQIINLLNTAGFAVGVGEWRPEKNGPFGMFSVAAGAAQ